MKKHYPDNSPLIDKITWWVGVGFGSGLSPKAPGTMGSLASLLLIPLWQCVDTFTFCMILLVASLLGFYICGQTAKIMQVHDDGRIVWDEFVGQSLTFLPAVYFAHWDALIIILGFVLFRFFDIIKPFPISYLDKHIHGGAGIMVDDMVAGIFAALCLTPIVVYAPHSHIL